MGTGMVPIDLPEIAPMLAQACSQEGGYDAAELGKNGSSMVPLWILKYLPNMVAAHISLLHNAKGPNNTITTACAAGTQAIGEAFGGKVIRAQKVMHGKTDDIHHTGVGVFKDLPNPFKVTRYHSLAIEKTSFPDCLKITAETDDGEIMGVRHKDFIVEGVQFHPESILSEQGHALLKNFLQLK